MITQPTHNAVLSALLMVSLLLAGMPAHPQTPDSVRTELTTEPAVTIPNDTSDRAKTEQLRLAVFFGQIRKEHTIFHAGLTYGGLAAFSQNRPDYQRQGLTGFSVGIDHQFLPAWAVTGTVGWAAQGNSAVRLPFSSGWLGTVGVNYYPAIQRETAAGRSVNNIRNQLYLTAMYWQPLHNQVAVTRSGMSEDVKAYPFDRAAMIGYGTNSRRNRLAYYNAVVGVAYLFGRADWVRYPVQIVARVSFGIGF